jgi:proteasome lid subunit RPN8/RPN11
LPQESIGVAWPDGRYERLRNRDDVAPDHRASLELADVQRLQAAPGAILVHSHPGGPQCPSARDLATQAAWSIPFVVLPVSAAGPLGPAFGWGHAQDMPLIGRPFRHGLWDCYSLIRDFQARDMGVQVADYPRDWQWWSQRPPPDMYRAHFQAEHFVDIPLAEATRRGDVILYALKAPVPNHGAIVLEPDLILHHVAGLQEYDPGRRSGADLRHLWARFAVMALRHA